MSKPATVVFDLRRYLPGGWYLPGAHIVGTDADGTPSPSSPERVLSIDAIRDLIDLVNALRRRT